MFGRIILLALAFAVEAAGPTTASAQGWYLLAPPLGSLNNPEVREVLVDAPLLQWEQIAAFDTASACEATKSERADEALKRAAQISRTNTYLWTIVMLERGRATTSVCISAADPRLAERKPSR